MSLLDLDATPENAQVKTIRGYYQMHAKIYQATRWTFLFGRKAVVNKLKLSADTEQTLLEVGCGTGHNLSELARRFAKLRLIGVDISPDMLKVASRRLQRLSRRILFLEKSYEPGPWRLPAQPDVVLFSYCLTMINPGWENALQRAYEDLAEGGYVAVVDFHGSRFAWFTRWMGFNHVRMDKHLLPALQAQYKAVYASERQAYGGVWSYFIFIGKKETP